MSTPFPKLTHVYVQTLELSNLPDNWDRAGASPPFPDGIHRGLRLLEAMSLFLCPHSVEPLPNGRIRYRWIGPKGDLLLDMVPNRERFVYQIVRYEGIVVPPMEVVSIQAFFMGVLIPYLMPADTQDPSKGSASNRPLTY